MFYDRALCLPQSESTSISLVTIARKLKLQQDTYGQQNLKDILAAGRKNILRISNMNVRVCLHLSSPTEIRPSKTQTCSRSRLSSKPARSTRIHRGDGFFDATLLAERGCAVGPTSTVAVVAEEGENAGRDVAVLDLIAGADVVGFAQGA